MLEGFNMRKRYLPYEEKYLYFSNAMEALIKKIILLLLITLIISQLLITNQALRYWLVPVEKIEGSMIKTDLLI